MAEQEKCSKCYNKVKKLLCKFPEILDQTYDEKANKVTIKVVCCSPEKIRDKLCCKGRGSIKSVEIKEPDKKQEEQTKPGSEKKKNEAEDSKKPTEDPSPPPVSVLVPVPLPLGFCCDECYSGRPGGPCWRGVGVPYDGYYYGRPVCSCWGGWCRCGFAYYCTEEIQQGCTIM